MVTPTAVTVKRKKSIIVEERKKSKTNDLESFSMLMINNFEDLKKVESGGNIC